MTRHTVLRVVAKFLIAPIILYAFYVQWHGELGPGGGFQAGVIFAVAFILYGIVFGLEALVTVFPTHVIRVLFGLGVLIYAGTGFLALFFGKTFLDYSYLGHHAVHAQEWGIILVEIGVGITVATVMIAIYIAFASRIPSTKDEDW